MKKFSVQFRCYVTSKLRAVCFSSRGTPFGKQMFPGMRDNSLELVLLHCKNGFLSTLWWKSTCMIQSGWKHQELGARDENLWRSRPTTGFPGTHSDVLHKGAQIRRSVKAEAQQPLHKSASDSNKSDGHLNKVHFYLCKHYLCLPGAEVSLFHTKAIQ